MKTCLITGSSGFIGSALVTKLRELNFNVIFLTRKTDGQDSNTHTVDLSDSLAVIQIINQYKPHIVFHLAANTSRNSNAIDDFRQAIQANQINTLNLIEACLAVPNFERFIYLGTCEEYGVSQKEFLETDREQAITSYSYSKTAAVHLLQTIYRTHDFPMVVLRPALVYGPGQKNNMFIPALIQSLVAQRKFPMSLGEQTRDFIYIDDLLQACVLAIKSKAAVGQVINIGSGNNVPLRQIVGLIAKNINVDEYSLIDYGAVPYRKNEIMKYAPSVKLAKSLLGWSATTDLEDGLAITVNSYIS